jgi:hypothetical protein
MRNVVLKMDMSLDGIVGPLRAGVTPGPGDDVHPPALDPAGRSARCGGGAAGRRSRGSDLGGANMGNVGELSFERVLPIPPLLAPAPDASGRKVFRRTRTGG